MLRRVPCPFVGTLPAYNLPAEENSAHMQLPQVLPVLLRLIRDTMAISCVQLAHLVDAIYLGASQVNSCR